jgi:hypothetical protein
MAGAASNADATAAQKYFFILDSLEAGADTGTGASRSPDSPPDAKMLQRRIG